MRKSSAPSTGKASKAVKTTPRRLDNEYLGNRHREDGNGDSVLYSCNICLYYIKLMEMYIIGVYYAYFDSKILILCLYCIVNCICICMCVCICIVCMTTYDISCLRLSVILPVQPEHIVQGSLQKIWAKHQSFSTCCAFRTSFIGA